MTSASAIADDLITNLGAASVFGPKQVATDFSVMVTSACCCVVGFGGITDSAVSFGRESEQQYVFSLTLYVKHIAANSKTIERQLMGMVEKAISSLRSDPQLQTTGNSFRRVDDIEFSHDNMASVESGGTEWLAADGTVAITEREV